MPEHATPPFVRIRAGLLEPKHIRAMGGCTPLALYLWLQTRVRFVGDRAGCTPEQEPYRHEDAAGAMGVSRQCVRRAFRALVAGGYVTAARTQRGLHLTITKYRAHPVRVSESEHPEPRVSESEHPENPECRNLNARVSESDPPTNKERRATRDSREENDKAGGRTTNGASMRAREAMPQSRELPPAVLVYCQTRRVRPSAAQVALMVAAVATDAESLEHWRRAVEACEVNGIKPGNVQCAIDWYRGGIPPKYRPRAAPPLSVVVPEPRAPTPEEQAAGQAAKEAARQRLAQIKGYPQIGGGPAP